MKKTILILMLLLSTFTFSEKIGGVEVEKTQLVNGKELQLNGAGIRKKSILKLYVGGLYTIEKVTDSETVINGTEEVAIKLTITSKLISSEAMKEAVEEGFTSAATVEELAILQERIDKFTAVFESEIIKGDTFTFKYSKEKGTEGYKNDELLITVEGDDFKRSLFAIWIGDNPADSKLKKAMLGK